MRIIRGNRRGRNINIPAFFKHRPTTDFAKEGLFNIIENMYSLENIKLIDIFTGTGSISYEFASRGCQNITALDKNKKYVWFVQKEFKKMYPNEDFYNILHEDSLKFIKNRPLNYDIIFADPPFDMPQLETIPDIIFNNPNLNPEALLILEHSNNNDFSEHPFFYKNKRYGSVNFSFFQK